MKSKWFGGFALICTCMLGGFGCVTGESTISPTFIDVRPTRVGIVDIRGDIRGDVVKTQVEDMLAMELLRKGYTVIERSRIDTLLAEQDFQRSAHTTDAEAAEIGRVLNIAGVMMIDVAVQNEKLSVTSRMVSPETGEVLWIGTGRGGTGRLMSTVGGSLIGGLFGSLFGSGRGRDLATVAGGILGGAAGHTLAPQTQRLVQRIIRKMFADVPKAMPEQALTPLMPGYAPLAAVP